MPLDPENGGQDGSASTERVLLRTFSSRSAAELAAASLDAHGIESWITADDGGGLLPHLALAGGVKLWVLSTDAAAAAALLGAQPISSDLPPERLTRDGQANPDAASSTAPRRKGALLFLLGGIVLGVLLCLAYQAKSTRGGDHRYGYDRNGDRREDELRIYRNGHIKQFFKDRNFDGQWDDWADYDEQGRTTSFRRDNNFDGKADDFGTYYNGELVTEQLDTDFNGIIDVTYTFKLGEAQRAEWKPNGALFVTLQENFTNGILYEALRDNDGEGKFDEVIHYDAFHNPVKTNAFKLSEPAAP